MAPPKSNIWIYFKKLDHAYAVCKDCGQNVAHSGNTSNIRKHLNKHNNTSKLTTFCQNSGKKEKNSQN